MTSPNEQSLREKEDPVVTDSDPGTGGDEHQNLTLEELPEEENIIEAEDDPAGNVIPPLERVQSEGTDLQSSLMLAIKNQQSLQAQPLLE